MDNKNKIFKLMFVISFILLAFSTLNIIYKNDLYERDYALSEVKQLDTGWTVLKNGKLEPIEFPYRTNINQNEARTFYFNIGEEFNEFEDPAIKIYKYYADFIVKINNKVVYTSTNKQSSVSNTKGLSYIIFSVPKEAIGQQIELNIIGTINGNFNYNLEVPVLGERSVLYYDIMYDFPIAIYANIFIMTIGIFLIIVGFLIRKINSGKEFFNLGFFAFVSGAYMMFSTKWFHGFFPNTYLGYILEYSLFFMVMWSPLLMIIDEVDGAGKKLAEVFLIVEVSFFWLAYILLYALKIEFVTLLPIAQIGMLLSIIVLIVAGISSYYDNNVNGIRLVKSFIPMAIGIIIDLTIYRIFYYVSYTTLFTEAGLVFFLIIQVYYIYGNYNKSMKEKYKTEIYRKLAFNDQLTGVGSRVAYTKELNVINSNIEAYHDLWAVCVDLNNLKYYNDNFGHAMGDSMLLGVSNILTASLANSDTLYRTGGDEFVMFLKDYDSIKIKEYKNNLETIRTTYCKRYDIDVSFAIGFSKYNKFSDRKFENTINRADEKMYANKKEMKAELK